MAPPDLAAAAARPPSAAVQYVRAGLFLFVFTVLFVVPMVVGLYTIAVVVTAELTACLNVVYAFARALFHYVVDNVAASATSAALGLFGASAVAWLCVVELGVIDDGHADFDAE